MLVLGAVAAGFFGHTREAADKRVTAVQRDLDAANESLTSVRLELATARATLTELNELDERIELELDQLGKQFGDILSAARNLSAAAQPVRDSYNALGRLLQKTAEIAYRYEAIVRQYAAVSGPDGVPSSDRE
ncbi:hypothetical protein FACS1894151_11100 [Spirochaetia bacterium]|nr:hypothetical protein FACS1894151_11100 [Spirochaetia bacterium]